MYYVTSDRCHKQLISQRWIHFVRSIRRWLSKSDTTGTDWRKPFCGAPLMIYVFVWHAYMYVIMIDSSSGIRWNLCIGLLSRTSANTDRFTYRWDNAIGAFSTLHRSAKNASSFIVTKLKGRVITYASLQFCSERFISFIPRRPRREISGHFRKSFMWIGPPSLSLIRI